MMFWLMFGAWYGEDMDSQETWEFSECHINASMDLRIKCYTWNDYVYSIKQIPGGSEDP